MKNRKPSDKRILRRLAALLLCLVLVFGLFAAFPQTASAENAIQISSAEDLKLLAEQPENDAVLFEAAQYYAAKADYKTAIDVYERAFAADPKRPRFTNALMGIAEIYEIMGDCANAAKTWGRIVDLLENEWGLSEETDSSVTDAKRERARLLAKA